MSHNTRRTERHRWSTCDICGKRGYLTRDIARRVRRLMEDKALHVYECNSGLFHVGHTPPGTPHEVYRQRRNEAAILRDLRTDLATAVAAAKPRGARVIAVHPSEIEAVVTAINTDGDLAHCIDVHGVEYVTPGRVYAFTKTGQLGRLM